MLHYTTLHSVTLLHPEVPCVVDGMLKSGANGSLHNTTAECWRPTDCLFFSAPVAAPEPPPPPAPKPAPVAAPKPKAPRVRVRKQPEPEPQVPIVLKQAPTPWWPEQIDVPTAVDQLERRFVPSHACPASLLPRLCAPRLLRPTNAFWLLCPVWRLSHCCVLGEEFSPRSRVCWQNGMDGPVFVVADHCHDVLVLRHQLRDERAGHHHAFVLKSLMCTSLKRRVVVLDDLAHFSSIPPPS